MNESDEKALKEIFIGIGKKCAAEMIPLLKDMHPDALLLLPLYRSALVVLKQDPEEEKRGKLTILLYHDPNWLGQEMTKETLPRFLHFLEVWGQRSGPDLTLNRKRLVSMTEEEWHKYTGLDEIMKKAKKPLR